MFGSTPPPPAPPPPPPPITYSTTAGEPMGVGFKGDESLVVGRVEPGAPSVSGVVKKATLKAVNGEPVATQSELRAVILKTRKGARLQLVFEPPPPKLKLPKPSGGGLFETPPSAEEVARKSKRKAKKELKASKAGAAVAGEVGGGVVAGTGGGAAGAATTAAADGADAAAAGTTDDAAAGTTPTTTAAAADGSVAVAVKAADGTTDADDDDATAAPKRPSARQLKIAVAAAAACLVVTVGGAAGYAIGGRQASRGLYAPTPAPVPMPTAAPTETPRNRVIYVNRVRRAPNGTWGGLCLPPACLCPVLDLACTAVAVTGGLLWVCVGAGVIACIFGAGLGTAVFGRQKSEEARDEQTQALGADGAGAPCAEKACLAAFLGVVDLRESALRLGRRCGRYWRWKARGDDVSVASTSTYSSWRRAAPDIYAKERQKKSTGSRGNK